MKAISEDDLDLEEQEQQQQERVSWGARGSRRGRMPMEFDDDETIDMFGDGPISWDLHRLCDTDFYNSFDDDFDDHDVD